MQLNELFKLALVSLGHRRTRTGLTMLGIFIGIGAVVALVSLGDGLRNAIESQIEEIGADKIYVRPKSAGFGVPDEKVVILGDRDVDAIREVAAVKEVGGQIFQTAKIEYKDNLRYYYVFTIPEDSSRDMLISANLIEVQSGRMLRKTDETKVVVGSSYVDDLVLGRAIEPGNRILINEEEFEVVGTLKKIGDPGLDGSVILNEGVGRRITNSGERFDFITVQISKGEDSLQVAEAVKDKLRRLHDVKEGKEDFSVETPEQLLESFEAILGIVQAVISGIAAISLIVGSIGIMNTMYTSVLERRKEIGVMKAVGASPVTIMVLFLLESGAIGLIGGLIGIMLGYGLSSLIGQYASIALGSDFLQITLSWPFIIGMLAFAFVLGAVSGALPALRAAKLQPVEALRG